MSKRVVFLIQGTGRGHLSQAIGMKHILDEMGWELSACILGTTKNKKIPKYFYDKIGVPVHEIESPQFYTKGNKKINLTKTFFKNLWNHKEFKNSIDEIEHIVTELDADLVINFYEFLAGFWKLFKKNKTKMVSIGHQYMFDTKDFKFPDKSIWNKLLLKLNNKITSIGSYQKWALSFYFTTDYKDIKIIPPIIRNEVMDIESSERDFYLVYLCNEGYLETIREIAQNHSDKKFEVFLNTQEEQVEGNLKINPLSDTKFLELLSKCKGYITTSGFESVCEASILGKPCLLVPIENHYEQKCNAFDSQKIKAGYYSDWYDFDSYLKWCENHESNIKFKNWCEKSKPLLEYYLNSIFS